MIRMTSRMIPKKLMGSSLGGGRGGFKSAVVPRGDVLRIRLEDPVAVAGQESRHGEDPLLGLAVGPHRKPGPGHLPQLHRLTAAGVLEQLFLRSEERRVGKESRAR